LAKLGYVLDDLRTAPPNGLRDRAELWARVVVGKGGRESFAELLGVSMPLDKSIQPHCASRQHFTALTDVGLDTATDVLGKSPEELVALLSRSVEAAALAATAAFCVAAFELVEPAAVRTEHYGLLESPTTGARSVVAPQPVRPKSQVTSAWRGELMCSTRAASPQPAVSEEADAETKRRAREWARAKGYAVGERGRLRADLIELYLASPEGRSVHRSNFGNSSDDATEPGNREVREWARDKGYKVGDRGRVPTWMVDAFRRERRDDSPAGVAAEPVRQGSEATLGADEFFDFLWGV
jgi:hypothetical protein